MDDGEIKGKDEPKVHGEHHAPGSTDHPSGGLTKIARLLSLNVGLPREITWNGEAVRTAIWKLPVGGRRMVRKLNIDGDGQADLAGHGGEQRTVFVYQMESYHYWEDFLGRSDFMFGQFGENFTLEGLADDEVCIGDRYRIGNALFEVTQPRVTCYRLGIRMNESRMPALVVAHRRPGFYFRVLREGSIQFGKELTHAPVGSLRNVYLVVTDLEAARSRLRERGVDVGEIRHKTPIGAWDGGFAPGA